MISGHLGQSTSNHVAPNTDPLPLDAVAGLSEEVPAQVRELNQDPLPLDVVAGLSEEVPVQAQELNLHGALAGLPQEVPEHLGFVIQAQELQPGYMDVAVVLDSRRSINILVNALVRLIPVLEFVTPAREPCMPFWSAAKFPWLLDYSEGWFMHQLFYKRYVRFFSCVFCNF